MRPQIGKYCWDVTVNKGNEDAEEPEEMIHSRVEIQEESLLKVTEGFDQMHIEDDVEGIEEECIILEEVPDMQIISEERAEKTKVQSKITSFSKFCKLSMVKTRCEMGVGLRNGGCEMGVGTVNKLVKFKKTNWQS